MSQKISIVVPVDSELENLGFFPDSLRKTLTEAGRRRPMSSVRPAIAPAKRASVERSGNHIIE